MSEAQAGFRKGYSTIDNIFILDTVITKRLSKKRGKLFVDFKSAFDSVSREHLFFKLAAYGFSGKIFDILKAIYNNMSACIKTNCGITTTFMCNSGLRQGCILSALLFSLFLNELESEFRSTGVHGFQILDGNLLCLLYADDLVIFSDTIFGLQKLIDKLHDFCQKWKLTVNIQKTNVMTFKKGNFASNKEKWVFGCTQLEKTNDYKYLGVQFTSNGQWNAHQKYLAEQAKKALFALKSNCSKIGHLPLYVYNKIFDTKILPILHYGAEIWGFHDGIELERVHTNYCKFVLRVNKFTPNDIARAELGRHNLKTLRYVQIIRYWLKIINMSEDRYVHQCYLLQVRMDELNNKCWASNVKKHSSCACL